VLQAREIAYDNVAQILAEVGSERTVLALALNFGGKSKLILHDSPDGSLRSGSLQVWR